MKRQPVQPIKKIEDIEKINSYLRENNYKGYMIWQTGLNTGLRISDIIRLNVGDVYNKRYLNIIEQKTMKTKRFPIIESLQKILNEYCCGRDLEEPLFTNQFSTKRLDRTTAYRFIVKGCKEAGILENVGTHTMRKTFGYHHYKQFHDAVILQKIFNHSSLRITLMYIGIEQDEIDASYNNFTYKERTEEQKEYYEQYEVDDITNIKSSINKLANICRNLEYNVSKLSNTTPSVNTAPVINDSKIISFLKNYIENGGIKHREFAELALSSVNE